MITTPSLPLRRSSEQLFWGTVGGKAAYSFMHSLTRGCSWQKKTGQAEEGECGAGWRGNPKSEQLSEEGK